MHSQNLEQIKSFDITAKTASVLFWLFTTFHILFWTIAPYLMQPSPSNYDVIEALVMAREWVMGTVKHPALPFWVLESIYQLFGRTDFSLYLAGQLWTMLGLWAVWRLSREFLSSESLALVVVLASAGYRYFNLGAISYTTSVPTVSLWCLTIYLFYMALKTGLNRYWIITGFVLGLGMLSKYALGLLAITLVMFLLYDSRSRYYLKSIGPYLMTITACLVFLPHFIWLAQNNFVCICSANEVVVRGDIPFFKHLVFASRFFFSQIFLFIAVLFGLVPLTGCCWQLRFAAHEVTSEKKIGDNYFNWYFLTFVIFVPFIIQTLLSVIFGTCQRPAYGSPLWTYIGLWMLITFQIRRDMAAIKRAVVCCLGVLGIIVACYVVDYQCYYSIQEYKIKNHPEKQLHASKIHFPGKPLGKAVTEIWQQVSDSPCPYLTGEWQMACYAACNMKDRPCALCYYFGLEPGKNPVGLYAYDKDVIAHGGVILWPLETDVSDDFVPPWLEQRYPTANISPVVLSIPYLTTANVPPLRVRYAILPPPSATSRVR